MRNSAKIKKKSVDFDTSIEKEGWQMRIYLNPGNEEFYNAVRNSKYMLIKQNL